MTDGQNIRIRFIIRIENRLQIQNNSIAGLIGRIKWTFHTVFYYIQRDIIAHRKIEILYE